MSLLLVLAPHTARKWIGMLENCILKWLSLEGLVTVQSYLLVLPILDLLRLLLQEVIVGILLIVEFGKETSAVLQLNVALFFHLAVQVGLNLAATPLAHVARHQVLR